MQTNNDLKGPSHEHHEWNFDQKEEVEMHQQIEGLGLGRHPQEPIIHKVPLGEFLAKIARH